MEEIDSMRVLITSIYNALADFDNGRIKLGGFLASTEEEIGELMQASQDAINSVDWEEFEEGA